MGLIEIGRIVRPHGLTGRVKALSYLESPDTLNNIPGLFVGRTVQGAVLLSVVSVQTGKDVCILQLGGVDDRDAAEGLRGSSLWISPEGSGPLPEGEYFWSEIIGLQVVTEEGESLGRIESVFPTGSNDVYVCRGEGREILLPAIAEVVRKIDTERGVMVVRLMKGLC